MRRNWRAHYWSLLLAALFATIAAPMVVGQFADAAAPVGWSGREGDGCSIAVAPFLTWLKGIDFARIIETVVAFVRKIFGGKASPARSRPTQPQTSSATVGVPSADDGDSETVLVDRLSFGSITFVTGTLVGRRWEIPPQGLTIGRDPKSDVVLTDRQLSVKHAIVRPKGGRVIVVDDGSMNGVFLNTTDNRVSGEAPLENGDLVMLSSTDVAQFIYRR